MIDRRSFLGSSAVLMLGAALPRGSFAAIPGGRLVWGVPAGAQRSSVGYNMAQGALDILAKQSDLRYMLEVIDARNSLQASETVKLAPADGTTLLQTQSGSMVLFPAMYKKLSYSPLGDFTPLAALGDFSYALSVGPAVPNEVATIDQYLTWVGKNPDYRDVGFSLYGSHNHLIALMLARAKEVALRAQSYKGLEGVLSDLRSSTLAAAVTPAGLQPLLTRYGARVLAISSDKRLDAFPGIATFKEQGLSDIVVDGWYGWFAPSRTPAATLQELTSKVNAMAAAPQFVELQKKLLITPRLMTPTQITQRIKDEIVINQRLVTSYNLSQIN